MSIIDTDHKYIVFKRADFERYVSGEPAPSYVPHELRDAVVIRRQDLFAAPALATYASCIAIARMTASDELVRKSLLDVGDYFERQAQLAAAEGFKLPDV